jgi:quercetin dioxygenase-like cupin family protein
MAQETRTDEESRDAALEALERVDAYKRWQAAEGVPVVGGFYIEDLNTLELNPWPRKGGRGAIVNLEGTGGINDAHVVEIAPGGTSNPERHLYEEMVYIVSGRGSTSVWWDDGRKQTFEWGRNSLFSIPLNAWYQHFNGSGTEPARYLAVTNLPAMLNLFHNADFIFNNRFAFRDRFAAEDGYFGGEGQVYQQDRRRIWQGNLVPDLLRLQLHSRATRGGGGSIVTVQMAENSMGSHVSQFQPGTYKKAHRHGPGAHVIILDGQGYSLLWPEGTEPRKYDWHPGTVVVPPENWFHQHFNTGAGPARYLALRFSGRKFIQPTNTTSDESDVSVTEGGKQIEYEHEERKIHELFEAEVHRHGATCRMRGLVDWCTGEVGPTRTPAAAGTT